MAIFNVLGSKHIWINNIESGVCVMINNYKNVIKEFNAAEILINAFMRNLVAGLSTIYVAIGFILSRKDIMLARATPVSILGSALIYYIIPKLIGLLVIAVGMHIVRNGLKYLEFYSRNVKRYHKKNVRIIMKENSTYPFKCIEGILFIHRKRLAIVSVTDGSESYHFIQKGELSNIESLYIDDIKTEGVEEYFEYIMNCLEKNSLY